MARFLASDGMKTVMRIPGDGCIPGAATTRGRALWLMAVPLSMAALAYVRVLDGEFQFDDMLSVERNSAIRDLGAYLRDSFVGSLFHSGRPVTELTFALNYATGGLDPRSFHLTNLAIHLAVAALVFLFTRKVLQLAGAASADGIAVAVAGVFALHPLQSQAVSYVSQRAEALASGLYLTSVLLLLWAEQRRRSGWSIAAYAGACAAFVLGLGAKVIVLTLPATYLLLGSMVPDAKGRNELVSMRKRLVVVAPLLAFVGYFCFTTLSGLEGRSDGGFDVPGLPAASYFLTQWRVLVTYLRLLFWPFGQNVDWSFSISRTMGDPAVLAAGLLLLFLAAGAVGVFWRWGREEGPDAAAARVAAFGLLWFFLLLAPTSSVVPLSDLLMEHRVYLASWGIFAAVAVSGERLLSRMPRVHSRLAARAIVLTLWTALGVVLYQRNAVWETQLALWTDAVAKSPLKARPHYGLGYAHQGRAEYDWAIREYSIALELVPGSWKDMRVETLRNLGVALLYARRADQALVALRQALALDPQNADVLGNLAIAMLVTQDLVAAQAYGERAVAARPDGAKPLQALGLVLMMRGEATGALALLQRAVHSDPEDGVGRVLLGNAYAQLGRVAEACASWSKAFGLKLQPQVRQETALRAAASGCPRR